LKAYPSAGVASAWSSPSLPGLPMFHTKSPPDGRRRG
jgi:hypothetical protein